MENIKAEFVNQLEKLVEQYIKEGYLGNIQGEMVRKLYITEIKNSVCKNLGFVRNPVYCEILEDKLVYELGIEPVFSKFFVRKFLLAVESLLISCHIHLQHKSAGLIEKILSLSLMGISIEDITMHVGCSHRYATHLKNDYANFEKFIDRWEIEDLSGVKKFKEHSDLEGSRLFLFWEIHSRLQVDAHYFPNIYLDILIEENKLSVDRSILLAILQLIHSLSTNAQFQTVINVLKGDMEDNRWKSFFQYGLMNKKSKYQISAILNELISIHILKRDTDADSGGQIFFTDISLRLLSMTCKVELANQIELMLAKTYSDKSNGFEEAVQYFLSFHPIVAIAVINVLSSKGNPLMETFFYKLTDFVSHQVLQKIIEAYGKSASVTAVPLLTKIAIGRDASTRAHCARAIGKIGDIEGFRTLIDMLNDPAISVRLSAIVSLCELHNKEAIPYLEVIEKKKLEKDSVKIAANRAISLLKQFGVNVKVPELA